MFVSFNAHSIYRIGYNNYPAASERIDARRQEGFAAERTRSVGNRIRGFSVGRDMRQIDESRSFARYEASAADMLHARDCLIRLSIELLRSNRYSFAARLTFDPE